MNIPLKRRLLLAALSLGLPCAALAQSATLVEDLFTDGGYTNGTDANDAAWNVAGGAALSIVADSGTGTLNDGNALQADATSFPSTVKANFASKTLQPGDSLTLTVRFRIYGSNTANAKGLRLGLGSSAGTYGFDIGTGGTNGGEFRRYANGLAAAGSATAIATTGAARTVNATTPRRLVLTLQRTDTTAVSLRAELVVDSSTTYVWTATDSASILTTFDGIALSQENTTLDVRYDGIKVVHSPRTPSLHRVAHWQFDDPVVSGEPRVQSWDKSTGYQHLRLRQGATAVDLHGANGSGVSGASDDRVLTLPTANSHGLLQNPQADMVWQQFPRLTFCGWVKASAVPDEHHLVDWTGDERVQLHFPDPGILALRVGPDEIARTNAAVITSTEASNGTWVFLAATYTGGLSSGGVKFYKGTATTAVALVANAASPVGDTTASGAIMNGSTNPGNLYLGNNKDTNQVFPGVIDDFRIYDGALSLSAGDINVVGRSLEDIRCQGFTPKNLLMNGDFGRANLGSHSANGWGGLGSQWQYSYVYGASPGQQLDSTVGNFLSSPRSQRLVTDSAADLHDSSLALTQGVQLRAGRVNKVTVWAKAATAGTQVRFMLCANPSTVYGLHTFTFPDNTQFHEIVFHGGTSSHTNAAFAVRMLTQPATVWVDDVSVEEIEPADGVVRTLPDRAVPGAFFGIHINWGEVNVWPQMGQKTLRLWDSGTRWRDLELTQGVWQTFHPTGGWPTEGLNKLNKLINKAHDNTPSPTILYTGGNPPSWAAQGGDTTKPPVNLSHWTNYVTQVATRTSNYQNASDPMNAARPIDYWEIWNETDGDFYSGSTAELVALTKSTRETLHDTLGLSTTIVAPNFTASGLVKMEDFLANDPANWTSPWGISYPGASGQFVDVWSIHAYSLTGTPENHRPFFGAVKDLLGRFSQDTKPLWNTEGSEAMQSTSSSLEAAGILARKYLTQWTEGITNYNWYAWDINWGGAASALGTAPKTSATLTDLGKSYRELTNWVVGAKILTKQVTRSQLGGERWVLEIQRPGGYKGWIVWDTAGSYAWAPTTAFPGSPNRVRKLDKTWSAYNAGSFQIDKIPVLIDGGSYQAALIDFGAAASPYPTTTTGWNNVNIGTSTLALVDPYGLASDLTLSVDQPFNTSGTGGNTNGTTSPSGAAAAYASSATRDSLYGNTAAFGGQSNRHPRVVISGLNPDLRYSLTYFASRIGTPVLHRSTDYVLTNGTTTDTKTLNAQDNASNVVSSAFLAPSSNGTLTLDLVKNSANTTAESFTYLGVLEIRVSVP